MTWLGSDQSYWRRSQMPPEPSVTSASDRPRLCTLRYSSALLLKSFERPGPKSVSPSTNCSGVNVVVWWKWISGVSLTMHIVAILSFDYRRMTEMQPSLHPKDLEKKRGAHQNRHRTLSKMTKDEQEPECGSSRAGSILPYLSSRWFPALTNRTIWIP